MDTQSLHSPIVRRFIETMNGRQRDDFLALFAPNAVVSDGPTYQGIAEIRTWAQEETFDMEMSIQEVQERDPAGLTIIAQATGKGGFTWQGMLTFTVRDDLIERLVFGAETPTAEA